MPRDSPNLNFCGLLACASFRASRAAPSLFLLTVVFLVPPTGRAHPPFFPTVSSPPPGSTPCDIHFFSHFPRIGFILCPEGPGKLDCCFPCGLDNLSLSSRDHPFHIAWGGGFFLSGTHFSTYPARQPRSLIISAPFTLRQQDLTFPFLYNR